MNRNLSVDQFDVRPDPKRPGQQGVLFRKVAPARINEPGSQRQGRRRPERSPATGNASGLLNPDQLYHGTSAEKRPGSLLRPGHPQNWPMQTMDTKKENVFATHNLADAYHFAMRAAQERGGTPRIYKVRPTGPVQVDKENRPTSEDWENRTLDYEGDIDEIEHFQSKSPMRIEKRVPISWGREEHYDMHGEYMPTWIR